MTEGTVTKRLVFALAAFALACGAPAAEDLLYGASYAFPSVQEGGGARAIAMGSTYVGIAEGSSAILWNPAGLAGMTFSEVALHHNSALAGAIQEIAVLGLALGRGNGLAASLTYEDNGSYEGRDGSGARLPDYSSRAYGLGLAWGLALPAGLSLGIGAKVNRQDLAGTASSAFAADFGALWSIDPLFTIGAAYTNFGPDVDGRRLAQGIRLGVSSELFQGSNYQWTLALSEESMTFGADSLHLGAEHLLHRFLALRAGYLFNVAKPQAAGLLGWTFGGGIQFPQFCIDYAFVPLAELGGMQRVSLTYAFGQLSGPHSAGEIRAY